MQQMSVKNLLLLQRRMENGEDLVKLESKNIFLLNYCLAMM